LTDFLDLVKQHMTSSLWQTLSASCNIVNPYYHTKVSERFEHLQSGSICVS